MRAMVIVASVLLAGCASSSTTQALRDSLVAGNQAEVNAFAEAFLSSGAIVDEAALDDDRLVARDVLLVVSDEHRVSQYGVDRVSDYFLCLFEIKAQTSTRAIVLIESDDDRCKSEDQCEICNSLVHPVPPDIRESLKQYWQKKLR